MKVNIKYSNYIKILLSPQLNDIVLLKNFGSNYLNGPTLSMKPWCNTKVTITKIFSDTSFQIKEDGEVYYWHKSWIKCNYSNYKFEVL